MFSNGLLQMDTSVGQQTKTYIYQLCLDTGWSLDDLLREMTDRNRETIQLAHKDDGILN